MKVAVKDANVLIDLVEGASAAAGVGELGSLAVVGRPGRIGLGRISRGLERWLRGQP